MKTRPAALAAAVLALLFAAAASAFGAPAGADPASAAAEVTIYYNGSCHDCVPYLDRELEPLLRSLGYTRITRLDYIVDRRHRRALVERSEALGVPARLQGHMTTFVGDRVVLQGHVPASIIRDLLAPARAAAYRRIVVLQDVMVSHGGPVREYTVWAPGGEIVTYPIDTPIAAYLATLPATPPAGTPAAGAGGGPTGLQPPVASARSGLAFMGTVLGAGLLDGINPCAFSVLLFFVAFLFTLHRDRRDLLLFGLVYIAAIYVTYLGIGLGLLTVFQLGAPHLFARLGAGLMIALGLVNIKDYVWYGRGFSLTVPKVGAAARDRWMRRATLPATAVVGFLVGICEFPCTGGVYVGILGLLASQTTWLSGLGYLLAYNAMFVLPLVALLLAVGNRRVVGQFSRWMATNKRQLRLGQGAVMIALGAVILLWFV